jgi:hypothetical protein
MLIDPVPAEGIWGEPTEGPDNQNATKWPHCPPACSTMILYYGSRCTVLELKSIHEVYAYGCISDSM